MIDGKFSHYNIFFLKVKFYFVENQAKIQIKASQIFAIFEIKIFIKASIVLFFFKREIQDLNSGQLVRVDKTTNQIIHFGAFETSEAKLTTGSKKYQATNKIITHTGR